MLSILLKKAISVTAGPGSPVTPYGVWVSGGNMTSARSGPAGCGTQTAGLVIGSRSPSLATSEEYNGSTWAAGGNMSTVRGDSAAAGTQTAAIVFGGYTGFVRTTYEYDGTSWVTGGILSIGRGALAGAGIQSSGLAITGRGAGGIHSSTEEYNNV